MFLNTKFVFEIYNLTVDDFAFAKFRVFIDMFFGDNFIWFESSNSQGFIYNKVFLCQKRNFKKT